MKGLVGLIAIGCAALLLACGGPVPEKEPVKGCLSKELQGAPQWVLVGCANMGAGRETSPICGVGSFSAPRDISTARSAAVGRARTDLARNLQVRLWALFRSVENSTSGAVDFGTSANDEQHVVDVAKEVSKITLSCTRVAATWMSKTGTLWMLVKLDPAAFSKAFSGMKGVDENVRRAVAEGAAKAFKELDETTDFQR